MYIVHYHYSTFIGMPHDYHVGITTVLLLTAHTYMMYAHIIYSL